MMKMSEYELITFLEEYIEALKKPIRFKYSNEEKIEYLKQVIKLIEELHDEIEELRNPIICGRSIDEIVNILTGLDIEKQYKIDVTMENLKSLMEIYQSEVEKSIQNAQIKIVDDMLGKGSKIEFELPHYNFDEENK